MTATGGWKGEVKKMPTVILSAPEVQRCQDVFTALDRGSGELPLRNLRSALQRLGIYPSEEDLFVLISECDPQGRGSLSFAQFQHLVGQHRHRCQSNAPMETSTLDAFVALGGNIDQSGVISTEKLRHVVMHEFALPIDIDKLITEADADGSGFIDFEEFTSMLNDPTMGMGSSGGSPSAASALSATQRRGSTGSSDTPGRQSGRK